MVRLQPLTRSNWEGALKLKLAEEQEAYLPSILFSIAQSRFEKSDLYGIYLENELIGFIMVLYFSEIPWISRFMIDIAHQRRGYGRAGLSQLIQKIVTQPSPSSPSELRTSIARRNAPAEYFFNGMGFERAGELDDQEFVMRLALPPRP